MIPKISNIFTIVPPQMRKGRMPMKPLGVAIAILFGACASRFKLHRKIEVIYLIKVQPFLARFFGFSIDKHANAERFFSGILTHKQFFEIHGKPNSNRMKYKKDHELSIYGIKEQLSYTPCKVTVFVKEVNQVVELTEKGVKEGFLTLNVFSEPPGSLKTISLPVTSSPKNIADLLGYKIVAWHHNPKRISS